MTISPSECSKIETWKCASNIWSFMRLHDRQKELRNTDLTPWLLDLLTCWLKSTRVDSSGAPAKASQPPWFPPYSSELDVAATGATCAIGAVGATWAACIGIAAAMGGGFTKVALRLWKNKSPKTWLFDFYQNSFKQNFWLLWILWMSGMFSNKHQPKTPQLCTKPN